MFKSTTILMFSFCVFLAVGLSAAAVDVTGDWELTQSSPRGERTSVIHFEQTGDQLTVTMEGFRGDTMTGEGAIEGDRITWTVQFSGPRGDMTLKYSGTVEGDVMSGQVQMGERGTMEWKAARK